ncbi:hypothetical protein IFM89_016235 [Coptis chinensis]|uniref:FAR1 domain-containing protein n=1 Tax=Coptis chinensis TaxID=261450 RepID=A0A835I0G3_9MAGN|nr:hypothetical protein IFM89_016235 [Coptis chinensis]
MEKFDNLYSFEKHLWDLNLDVAETQETIDIDEEEGTNYQNDCQGATENEEAIGIDEEENVKNSIDCQDSIPKIGMIFNSESEAYSSYNQYTRIVGFSVRRSHQKKIKNGQIRRRQYVCSKEGVRATILEVPQNIQEQIHELVAWPEYCSKCKKMEIGL